MNLKVKVSPVFLKNFEARTPFVVNQGGSRSTKTYSIAQTLIMKAVEKRGRQFTIARKTLQALKGSAMRDFFDILKMYDLYDDYWHNKTDNTYELNGNLFEFMGMDQAQKKRGAKRDILWMNEANEFTFEDFTQFNLRTSQQIFFDYNPSEDFWIDDNVLSRGDDMVTFIRSTYLDNGFLSDRQVTEIENLEHVDEALWKVFGLGEKAIIRGVIYTNWTNTKWPEGCETVCYGLDFGYVVETALTEVGIFNGEIYIRELIYETQILTNELITKMKDLLPNRKIPIYADSAEPDRINEIYRAGFNIHPSKKDWSVGVDFVKRIFLHIDTNSPNLKSEIKTYKRKEDKNGNFIDEPVKYHDHLMDSMRYAIYSHSIKYGAHVFGLGEPRKPRSGAPRERKRRSDGLEGFGI